MEIIYNLCIFGVLISVVLYIAGLIKPKFFTKPLGVGVGRKKLTLVFIPVLVALFFGIGAFEPASVKQARLAEQANNPTTSKISSEATPKSKAIDTKPQPVVSHKTDTQTKPVDFTSETREDSTLTKGQTKTTQEGVAGQLTLTYDVTYTDGIETGRKLLSDEVTTQPINKIVSIGTYVAPAPTTSSSSGSCDGYINSAGNCIASPSSDPTGATAKCRDGTYSYSQSRSGTCSHHGGVASWL